MKPKRKRRRRNRSVRTRINIESSWLREILDFGSALGLDSPELQKAQKVTDALVVAPELSKRIQHQMESAGLFVAVLRGLQMFHRLTEPPQPQY